MCFSPFQPFTGRTSSRRDALFDPPDMSNLPIGLYRRKNWSNTVANPQNEKYSEYEKPTTGKEDMKTTAFSLHLPLSHSDRAVLILGIGPFSEWFGANFLGENNSVFECSSNLFRPVSFSSGYPCRRFRVLSHRRWEIPWRVDARLHEQTFDAAFLPQSAASRRRVDEARTQSD